MVAPRFTIVKGPGYRFTVCLSFLTVALFGCVVAVSQGDGTTAIGDYFLLPSFESRTQTQNNTDACKVAYPGVRSALPYYSDVALDILKCNTSPAPVGLCDVVALYQCLVTIPQNWDLSPERRVFNKRIFENEFRRSTNTEYRPTYMTEMRSIGPIGRPTIVKRHFQTGSMNWVMKLLGWEVVWGPTRRAASPVNWKTEAVGVMISRLLGAYTWDKTIVASYFDGAWTILVTYDPGTNFPTPSRMSYSLFMATAVCAALDVDEPVSTFQIYDSLKQNRGRIDVTIRSPFARKRSLVNLVARADTSGRTNGRYGWSLLRVAARVVGLSHRLVVDLTSRFADAMNPDGETAVTIRHRDPDTTMSWVLQYAPRTGLGPVHPGDVVAAVHQFLMMCHDDSTTGTAQLGMSRAFEGNEHSLDHFMGEITIYKELLG